MPSEQPREGEAARVEDQALTVIEFLQRLNVRPEATPNVKEAAAMEALASRALQPAPEQPTREARVDLAERANAIAHRMEADPLYNPARLEVIEICRSLRASAHPEATA